MCLLLDDVRIWTKILVGNITPSRASSHVTKSLYLLGDDLRALKQMFSVTSVPPIHACPFLIAITLHGEKQLVFFSTIFFPSSVGSIAKLTCGQVNKKIL